MFSYIANAYTQGIDYAKYFINRNIFYYGGLILYLSFSFSRFEIVRGYLAPFSIGIFFLIPKIKRSSDYSGLPIKIGSSKRYQLLPKYSIFKTQLPQNGYLTNRIVIDGNLESYIVKLETPLVYEEFKYDQVVIMPKKQSKSLNESGNILVYLLFPTNEILSKSLLTIKDFIFAGWAISKRINEVKIN